MRQPTKLLATSAALMISLAACGETGGAESTDVESGLPDQMVWSSYGVGTSAYAELGAVSEVLTREYGTNIRIITSDTGVGRLTPVRNGQADVGRLSDEAFYAFDARYNFIDPEWGPQDIRAVWTPPTTVAVGVRADSGIDSLEDLAGKRVPWMPANPSGQEKIEGILAYAEIDPDDVEKVQIDYSQQPQALQDGQLDMVYFGVESAAMAEVASQLDFKWLSFEGDAAAVGRLQEKAPTVTIEEFTSQIGMEGEETKRAPTYSIQMATYADYDAEAVYALVKAFDEHFDDYRDITTTSRFWDIEVIDWMPKVLPYHDGTVRYLEERGVWTEEHEAANQAIIERGEVLREGWEEVVASAEPDQLTTEWEAWKAENAPLVVHGGGEG